jgi:Ca2+-binding RTX toxin-like protein
MRATFLTPRITRALGALTLTGAVLAAAPAGPAVGDSGGDPVGPAAPEVTSGVNGLVATTQQYYDGNGLPTSASLRASNGYGYFHPPDSNSRTNDPEFSPDGTRLAYSAYGGASAAQGIWVVANPFGHYSNLQRLTDSQYDTDPTWSPDGNKIAFIRSQSNDNGIWMVDAAGGTPVQILRDSSFYGEDLSWSPDGTRLTFSDYSGSPFASPMHVYVMDVDGGTPVDLALGSSPSWSPDGGLIAFQFPFSSTDIDIARMKPDGTDRFAVIGSVANEYEPTWSPDGRYIAFLTAAGVHTYSVADRTVAQLLPGTNFFSTTWGPSQPTCQGRPATMAGTPGNDVLRGSRGVDVIHGMAGDDTILGMQGQDIICGGTGNDTVSYAGQIASATAYVGETDPASGVSDRISGDVENLTGGDGADRLTAPGEVRGGGGADLLAAGGPSARLFGGTGDDRLVGGIWADVLFGEGGEDVLIGDEGADAMDGAAGDDVLRGGPGDDDLAGGPDDDDLYGGADNDMMDGGLGADLLNGGADKDTVSYSSRTIGVDVTIGGGGSDDGSKEDGAEGERDVVRGSVENVRGGSGADVLIGNEGANQLTGNLGADELRGGDGRDVLRAADGIRDRVIDCGGDTDADAQRDDIDPAAISCP